MFFCLISAHSAISHHLHIFYFAYNTLLVPWRWEISFCAWRETEWKREGSGEGERAHRLDKTSVVWGLFFQFSRSCLFPSLPVLWVGGQHPPVHQSSHTSAISFFPDFLWCYVYTSNIYKYFIYFLKMYLFCLCWVSIAVPGLSLVAVSDGYFLLLVCGLLLAVAPLAGECRL